MGIAAVIVTRRQRARISSGYVEIITVWLSHCDMEVMAVCVGGLFVWGLLGREGVGHQIYMANNGY